MTVRNVSIGDKFNKPLSKGKSSLCEVTNFIKRESMLTGKLISIEVWGKSIDGNYFQGKEFETRFSNRLELLLRIQGR